MPALKEDFFRSNVSEYEVGETLLIFRLPLAGNSSMLLYLFIGARVLPLRDDEVVNTYIATVYC